MFYRVFVFLLVFALGVPSAWARPKKKVYEENSDDNRNTLRKAPKVLKKIPASLDMKVGQRVSFEGVFVAGTYSKKVIRLDVSGGVMTVLAIGEGPASIELHGTARPKSDDGEITPKKIRIKVTR